MISLHANSSLPRSGSELLQALLAQHPDVYASATSPLLEYWYGAYGNYNLAERRSQEENGMQAAFRGFCKKGTEGYYRELTDRPVIIDKSRGWLEYAELLWKVFPDARIVCMVRDIGKIVDSLEKIYRANTAHPEVRHLPKTPEQRGEYWTTSGTMPLGLALDRIKGRQALGLDERIAYVNYDDLVASTVEVMEQVFIHYKLQPIKVDINNIKKSVKEDDSHYGIFGKHNVSPMIQPPQPEKK